MSEINIGGDPNDRSYRYKRPRCTTKIEGRGNGIKTVIPNMVDVAKALKVMPSYPTKFFGIELGAQSKFDKKREVAVVNGAHETSVIETLMEKFIEMYVLCPSPACRLPETRLKVRKELIKTDCAACGFTSTVGDSHKLTVYIVKNPPGKSKKSAAAKEAAEADKKKRAKKNKDGDDDAADVDDEAPTKQKVPVVEETVQWFTDTSDEAALARKKEEQKAMGENSDEIDLHDRLDQVLQVSQNGNGNRAVITSKSPAEEVLRAYLQQERSIPEVISELRRLELSRSLDSNGKVSALLTALLNFDDWKGLIDGIKKRSALLRVFTSTRQEAQVFLACFEHLVINGDASVMPRIALILQTLYEADILDEDVLIDWYDSPVSSAVQIDEDIAAEIRQHGKVFIDWLKADDDDDDDDE